MTARFRSLGCGEKSGADEGETRALGSSHIVWRSSRELRPPSSLTPPLRVGLSHANALARCR